MTIWQRISKRSSYQESFARGDSLDSFGLASFAGPVVTEDRALTMVAVYACVSLIADTIAAMPIDVYNPVLNGTDEPIAKPTWLKQPNTDFSSFDFWHRVLTSLLLAGNSYVWISRDNKGRIVELIPLAAQSVTTKADTNGRKYFEIKGEKYDTTQILHTVAFIRAGDLTGMAPIVAAKQAIGLGLAAEEYGSRFFSQGATMSGVIEVPDELNEDQAKIMAKSFAVQHSGNRKAHLPGVVTGGAKWQAITVPNDQAQFLESRNFQTSEIARLFRVPPHLIGDVDKTTSWGTGIEEQNRHFVEYTLQSWLTRLENSFSTLLPGGQYIRFNLDALLRGSTQERYTAHALGINTGFLTINEVRALENRPPVPGGDEIFRPLNYAPVGQEPPAEAESVPADPITPNDAPLVTDTQGDGK